jgi:hypothetical protein
MFRIQTPTADFTNKEKLEKSMFVLNKIYLDKETPILFKQLLPNLDINRTSDFLKFLEQIIKNEES